MRGPMSPDLTRQALFDRTWDNASARLTWQATPRLKLGAYWDEQAICARCTGANPQNGFPSPTTSPEALGHGEIGPPSRTQQLTIASPVTSRLLFEAGWGTVLQRYGGQPGDSPDTVNLTAVTEQCTAGCASNGNIPGLIYRSQSWSSIWNAGYNWHATGRVRDRRAQHEVRLSGRLSGQRQSPRHQQHLSGVPVQQRGAEPADRVRLPATKRAPARNTPRSSPRSSGRSAG